MKTGRMLLSIVVLIESLLPIYFSVSSRIEVFIQNGFMFQPLLESISIPYLVAGIVAVGCGVLGLTSFGARHQMFFVSTLAVLAVLIGLFDLLLIGLLVSGI